MVNPPTDPEQGLTTEEATQRLVEVGANDIETVPPTILWASELRKLILRYVDRRLAGLSTLRN